MTMVEGNGKRQQCNIQNLHSNLMHRKDQIAEIVLNIRTKDFVKQSSCKELERKDLFQFFMRIKLVILYQGRTF